MPAWWALIRLLKYASSFYEKQSRNVSFITKHCQLLSKKKKLSFQYFFLERLPPYLEFHNMYLFQPNDENIFKKSEKFHKRIIFHFQRFNHVQYCHTLKRKNNHFVLHYTSKEASRVESSSSLMKSWHDFFFTFSVSNFI